MSLEGALAEPELLSRITAILVSPTDGRGVGAAARAVKNMGLAGLGLIEHDPQPDAETFDQQAQRLAVEATDVLEAMRIGATLDDVRLMMEGELSPEVSEVVVGHIEIRRIFRSSKIGNIAGCYVLDGTVSRDSKVRLLRDGAVVYTGELASLKREKDDAKEVREGFECGLVLRNYNNIEEGDVVETYKLVETKRKL